MWRMWGRAHTGLSSGTACRAWGVRGREGGMREEETPREEGREETPRGSSGCKLPLEEGTGTGRVGSVAGGKGRSPRGC